MVAASPAQEAADDMIRTFEGAMSNGTPITLLCEDKGDSVPMYRHNRNYRAWTTFFRMTPKSGDQSGQHCEVYVQVRINVKPDKRLEADREMLLDMGVDLTTLFDKDGGQFPL